MDAEVVNIASDVASVLDMRLHDRRRSDPFRRLAERRDDGLARDLKAKLEKEVAALTATHPAVAEEIEHDYLNRLNRHLQTRS